MRHILGKLNPFSGHDCLSAARMKTKKSGGQRYQPVLMELENRRLLSLTALASFNGSLTGSSPKAGLIMDSVGNLYGVSTGDNSTTFPDGTVFELAKGSGTITTLASFSGANGKDPIGRLIMDSSGNLYGTTELGGARAYGTVFELVEGSGTITTLASFNSGNGEYPEAGVSMDSSGNLFGTAGGGVFELAKGSGTITKLASFINGSNPDYSGVILDSGGNLYGTTSSGLGAFTDGTIFELAKSSSTIATLFTFNGTNGAYPQAGVIMDSSGNLYGTTYGGGAFNYGTVYELAKGTNKLTTLASFNPANGYSGDINSANVIMDSSGNLYSTTELGGAFGYGTVFELVKGGSTLTTLASFNNSTNGAYPWAGGVIMDSSGNLYGTTYAGGTSSVGTVFEYTMAVTWTGAGTTDLWSNGKNWQGGVAPTAGSNLIFPTGALQETSVDDLGFTFNSINTADTYIFSGAPLTVGALTVSQGSLDLDSSTTVTGTLSIPNNTTFTVGDDTTQASLTLAANGTLSLIGILTVNTNATLLDNGTLTITGDGDLDDFGTVNIGASGTLTESQGLMFVGASGTISDGGTVTIGSDTSFDDEGTLSVIGNGTLSDSGTISVGENAFLNLDSGSFIENSGGAMDIEGELIVGPGGSCTIAGGEWFVGFDPGTDNPADSALVATPITALTPPSTVVLQAAHQSSAAGSTIFQTIEVLAKDAVQRLPGDVAITQQAQALASFAKPANRLIIAAKYGVDIDQLVIAYASNNQAAFASAYNQFARDVNSDIYGLAVGQIAGAVTAATAIADEGASLAAVPLANLFGNLAGSAGYGVYYDHYLAADVTAQGMTLYSALKNQSSTGVPGMGGTLNDQGSVTVGSTGTLSDQDGITVQSGATLADFGNLIEGASGVQEVFGTLVVEPAGNLDIVGSLLIEPGATYTPSGTVTVEQGGTLNQLGASSSGLVYNRGTKLFGSTITLTNTGPMPLTGTFEVELTGLPAGVTLSNASGIAPDGNPYILIDLSNEPLAGGQSINFTVLFSDPTRSSFQYGIGVHQ